MKHETLILSAALALAACSPGTGSVTFTTWGEPYVEEEIPAAAFADGWRVTFSKFVVSIDGVRVADGDAVAGELGAARVYDHTVPGVKEVFALTDVEAKAWPDVDYEIVTPGAGATLDPSATQADLDHLVASGAALWVAGTATDGAVTKSFDWTIPRQTRYASCKGEVDGQVRDGILVTNGGDDVVELTIHGDHFFYDDLQSPDAVLRFQPMADADADADGAVTLAELAAVDLVAIPVGTYGTGSASAVNTLGDFVLALSQTVGHFRGEGECQSVGE